MFKFRKLDFVIKIFFCSFIISLFFNSKAFAAAYRDMGFYENVNNDKKFTIKFSTEVDESTINNNTVYVQAENGILQKIKYVFQDDHKTVVVQPETEYESGEKYYLYVNDKVKSKNEKSIKEPVKVGFSVKTTYVPVNNDTDIYNEMYNALSQHKKSIYMNISNFKGSDFGQSLYDAKDKVINNNKDLDVISSYNYYCDNNSNIKVNLNYYYFIDNSYSDECKYAKVSIDKKALLLGDTAKISTQIYDSEGKTEINYSVDNNSIASIDNNGNVKAIAKGDTDINVNVKYSRLSYTYDAIITIPIHVFGKDAKVINTLDDLQTAVRNGVGQDSIETFIKGDFNGQQLRDTVNNSINSAISDFWFSIIADGNYERVFYSYPNIARDEFVKEYNELNTKADQIISSIIKPDMSDIQKEMAIHNYLVLNTKYDYDNYLHDTIPSESYIPYGVLVKGIGVCQGYAGAAKLLLNKVGIECMVVRGQANGGRHAWNIVKINNKYYNLDTTWDDPAPDIADFVRFKYFNLSDQEISKDHKPDDGQNCPKCTDDSFNYLKNNIHDYKFLKYDGVYLYFINNDYKLSKMKYDGSENIVLCNDVLYSYKISDDYITYNNSNDNYKRYKIKFDGTGKESI